MDTRFRHRALFLPLIAFTPLVFVALLVAFSPGQFTFLPNAPHDLSLRDSSDHLVSPDTMKLQRFIEILRDDTHQYTVTLSRNEVGGIMITATGIELGEKRHGLLGIRWDEEHVIRIIYGAELTAERDSVVLALADIDYRIKTIPRIGEGTYRDGNTDAVRAVAPSYLTTTSKELSDYLRAAVIAET